MKNALNDIISIDIIKYQRSRKDAIEYRKARTVIRNKRWRLKKKNESKREI